MNVLVIIGSAGKQSSGSKLMAMFGELTVPDFTIRIWEDLESLPHFDPSLTSSFPANVAAILSQIELADGVVFCTPEYIFSIPARLKNLLEWCVATTVFTDKPVGIITASANGEQGHAQLQLIMHTLGAKLSEDAQLLIKGIKGKFDSQGVLLDSDVLQALVKFSAGFKILLAERRNN
ncbi:NAD(P)H-dependent FMN reductase [Pedobacter sp. AK017]|uniref:NADPH-dependent FMN reductase n=1 Tax=Pedobacter sp. AK017 TaxID=2723073 RepID=UPI00161C7FCF|nr:NADPH-dependent FMN reductase [Pedobacter sp. AK017]MBB5439864.1 NAD(P)H-dependent FMN reductase [Pedobacter sp. AK017]